MNNENFLNVDEPERKKIKLFILFFDFITQERMGFVDKLKDRYVSLYGSYPRN